MNVKIKYMKDEDNNIISPVVSTDSVYNGTTKLTSDYIKNLSVSRRTITYTKGDGTSGSLTTQDTTYSLATINSDGLLSSSDKSKLDYLYITARCSFEGKLFSVFDGCYFNNVRTYGFTIRYGSSSMDNFVEDTYWLSFGVKSGGAAAAGLGIQINGAKFPTWYSFL